MAFVNTPPPSTAPATERAGLTSDAHQPTGGGSDASSTSRRAWLDRRVMLAGITVALVRFALAADRRVFHLFADEPGQLAMARWLSGGTRWTMLDHNTWRPGYALVLAPLVSVFGSGEAMVRTALVVNALLAGVTTIVLARLVQRWSGLGTRACAAIAAVTALAPATIASSAYTWSESLITLVIVTTIWFLQRFVDDGRLSDAVAAVLVSGFAMTTHGRAATLLPTTVVVCSFLLARRGRGRHVALDVALIVAVAAALTIASQALTEWVHAAVWDEINDTNSTGAVIERLDAPIALLDSGVGQIWYQLVASIGLVGIGLAWVASAVFRSRSPLDRTSAAVLLWTTLPPIAMSIAFMSDRGRSDQLVYGRYLDTVVWPFFAMGLVVVARRLSSANSERARDGWIILPAVGAVLGVSGLALAFRHGDQLVDDIGLRMMVPALLPYVGSADGIPVLTITAIALGLLAAITMLSGRSSGSPTRWRRHAVVGLCLLGLSFSAIRIHDALAIHLNGWDIATSVAGIDDVVPDGEQIGLISDANSPMESNVEQRQRYQVYQLYLPNHEMVWLRTDADRANPPSPFVIAPLRDPTMVAADAQIAWRDPEKRLALWQLP